MIGTKGHFGTRIGLVFLLAGMLAAAAPAVALDRSAALVGSWSGAAEIDGTGQALPTLVTVHADGTFISTAPDPSVSPAHGTWERVGPRRFVSTDLGFIYDANGNLAVIQKVVSEITVSHDHDSYSGRFRSDIMLPDGTVVANLTGSTSGARIHAEAF